jgi:serine/threonine protein kinase
VSGLGAGRVVGRRYELTERLVEGGMGAVWSATDRKAGKEVVVKLMHASLVADAEAVQRFEQEASVMRSLRSPHIVSFITHGMQGRIPYLVLERLYGEDLEERLQRGPLSLEETARLLDEMAHALLAASARGVVHRDIKPANIYLAREGEGDTARTVTKLLDFGIVKLREGRRIRTAFGVTVGSPGFMSPEQVRGEALDTRSDLFALAAVAYACVTGRSAFDGGSDIGVTFQNILHARFTPPSRVRPGLPAAVDAFFQVALAPAVDDRFQHAAAMARAFREAISGATGVVELLADAPRLATGSLATKSDPPALRSLGEKTRMALRAHLVAPLARARDAATPHKPASKRMMIAAAALAIAGTSAAVWAAAGQAPPTEVAGD